MEKLKKTLDKLSILFDEEKTEKLLNYYREISISANNFNLTALKNWEDIRDTLFIRSLRYAYLINSEYSELKIFDNQDVKILDLGTGAGIPSIPIKILYPNMNLSLLESSHKKCEFLEKIIQKLNLEKVQIYNKRAEVLGQSELRESFDLVFTRALAKLPSLAELSIPLIKIGGMVITAKGNLPEKEIKESEYITKFLGATETKVKKIIIPKYLPDDHFVIWKKIKKTPNNFPRKDGIPQKKPIIKKIL